MSATALCKFMLRIMYMQGDQMSLWKKYCPKCWQNTSLLVQWEEVAPKFVLLIQTFETLPKINARPIGENSSNLVTLLVHLWNRETHFRKDSTQRCSHYTYVGRLFFSTWVRSYLHRCEIIIPLQRGKIWPLARSGRSQLYRTKEGRTVVPTSPLGANFTPGWQFDPWSQSYDFFLQRQRCKFLQRYG
jgi:hypothetical protein